MTTAPSNLLSGRSLLLDHLSEHGLSGAEVGIVGDAAHIGEGDSYHLGTPEQGSSGYSVSESSRDRNGLCGYASATDVGSFSVTVGGKVHNLRTFSVWLVAECAAGAPDTLDIREVIYSPDGKVVRRWDRLKRRTSGDSSHLWHTHISVFRDATKAGRGLVAVFTRYLTEIGLIKPAEEDDMTPAQAYVQHVMNYRLAALRNNAETFAIPAFPAFGQPAATETNYLARALRELGERLSAPAPVTVAVDEAVTAAIAKAVNDDEARRMTQ